MNNDQMIKDWQQIQQEVITKICNECRDGKFHMVTVWFPKRMFKLGLSLMNCLMEELDWDLNRNYCVDIVCKVAKDNNILVKIKG